jgi:hypothetical protein
MGISPGKGTGVTHGICPSCLEKMKATIPKKTDPNGQPPASPGVSEDKDRPWIKDINRPWLPNG